LPFGEAGLAAYVEVQVVKDSESEDTGEFLVLVPELPERGVGKILIHLARWVCRREPYELRGVSHRQHFEQNRVNQTEDRSIRANAERQREHCHSREGRVLRQDPQAKF
jgi:hypothetical protein